MEETEKIDKLPNQYEQSVREKYFAPKIIDISSKSIATKKEADQKKSHFSENKKVLIKRRNSTGTISYSIRSEWSL